MMDRIRLCIFVLFILMVSVSGCIDNEYVSCKKGCYKFNADQYEQVRHDCIRSFDNMLTQADNNYCSAVAKDNVSARCHVLCKDKVREELV